MKRLLNITFLLIMLMSMVGFDASAHDIAVENADGVTIYYNFINNTKLEVTYRGSSYDSYSNEYSGNVVIPESVTYNGKTYSVTSIGNYAFYGCSGLTSITIPNNVTSIASSAFTGCSGLTSVTVNSNDVLSGTSSSKTMSSYFGRQVKTYILGNNVTSIGESAFKQCSGLTSINIPNSVTSIGRYAFWDCSGLTSVTIGNSVTSIGDHAFYSCSGLTSVTIPNSVTSIGDHAFYSCSGLTSVTIPNSVTSIGNYAFYGCSGLTSVTIGSGVTSIGNSAFYDCDGLTSVTVNSNYILSGTSYSKNMRSYFGDKVKTYVIGNNVTSIGQYAFYGCSELTSITIPNSVTSIGNSAFSGCSGLTSITIPNSVTSIGDEAFRSCSGLTSITIPNSVTSIGNGAFLYCSGLTSIKVQEGNTKYDSRNNCNAIIETASNTLVTGCKNTIIPNNVTSIGGGAFGSCYGLTSITIPNSVIRIENSAFNGCSGLTSITISENVMNIGDYAFIGCSKLTSVVIPDEVFSIGKQLFFNCSNLTDVTIGNGVTGIGADTFHGCTNLKSVTLGKSIESVDASAFTGCSGITSIRSYIENPTAATGVYFDISNYSNATLYVPQGTKNKYLATSGWKNFANIVEMAPTPEPSSDNTLAISNAETYAGKQIVLPIDMNNVASIKAFQFDLYLPDGVTIAKDGDNEYMVELTSRAAKSHTIAYSNRPDGAIRMVCTSMSGATFKGNEGTIVNVTLDVAQSMTDGDYDIEIKNIELSDGTPYNPADIKATLTVKTYTPGDVDGTGTVSVNDAVCVINYILGSPAEDFIEPAADLDGNGVITVNDVVILINDYILGGNSQNSLDLAFLQDVTADDDYLYIEEDNLSNMTAGEEREIEVFMNTSRTDIQGLQCDIYLPDGMEFVPEEDGDEKYYADKGGRAAKSHSVAAKLRADGSLGVVETSTSGAKFKANELAVFYFTVRATANTAYGQGIRLCNMELSYGGAPINPEDRTFDVKVNAGTVSLNSEGYATFSHASDVEVEGAEVYTATRNGNIISCTKEEQSVAAFNGVILKGEPDATVTLYTNNGVEGYTGNELKPTTTADGLADIETALVLSGNMFKNYTGAAFDADKAYMPYDGNSINAIGIVFNGATAINSIASENNLLDGAVIKTVEDGRLVIKTANGKYSSVGAKMK